MSVPCVCIDEARVLFYSHGETLENWTLFRRGLERLHPERVTVAHDDWPAPTEVRITCDSEEDAEGLTGLLLRMGIHEAHITRKTAPQ